MKIITPPDFALNALNIPELLQDGIPSPLTPQGHYEHWDKIRFAPSPEQHWQKIKLGRLMKKYQLPFADAADNPFWFCQLDQLAEFQHWIDQQAAGMLGADTPAAFDKPRRARFLMDGFTNEAIYSSQLEGAATTRLVAQKILAKSNPKPATIDETMIINNYKAMEFIAQIKDDPLTLPLILELQSILTADTLNAAARGRLRNPKDDIAVYDNLDGTLMHRPPPTDNLYARMENLCDFANGKTPKEFLHPALRAIILHFMLAFEHPFTDGNGRTARALFYWAMARGGYWLMPFVSISEIIKRAPRKYYRAFMHSETDQNDITYFLLHQTQTIKKGFTRLGDYIKKQAGFLQTMGRLSNEESPTGKFNRRQMELLRRAMEDPRQSFSARLHQARHQISYPTARADLLMLAAEGFLSSRKIGKEYLYFPPDNLAALLNIKG